MHESLPFWQKELANLMETLFVIKEVDRHQLAKFLHHEDWHKCFTCSDDRIVKTERYWDHSVEKLTLVVYRKKLVIEFINVHHSGEGETICPPEYCWSSGAREAGSYPGPPRPTPRSSRSDTLLIPRWIRLWVSWSPVLPFSFCTKLLSSLRAQKIFTVNVVNYSMQSLHGFRANETSQLFIENWSKHKWSQKEIFENSHLHCQGRSWEFHSPSCPKR